MTPHPLHRPGTHRHRRKVWVAGLVALAAASVPGGGEAQERRTLAGVTVGRWWSGSDGVVDVAVHLSTVDPGGFGFELSMATSPALLAYRVLALAPEIGLTWSLEGDGFQIRPRVGPMAVVGVGGGALAAVLGVHAGSALLVPTRSDVVFRLEGAARLLGVSGHAGLPVLSLGAGFMWGEP